jgi:hypothetical protein
MKPFTFFSYFTAWIPAFSPPERSIFAKQQRPRREKPGGSRKSIGNVQLLPKGKMATGHASPAITDQWAGAPIAAQTHRVKQSPPRLAAPMVKASLAN